MNLFSELIARAREDVAGTLLLVTVSLVAALKLETVSNTASVCDPADRACVESTVGASKKSTSAGLDEIADRKPSSVQPVAERTLQNKTRGRKQTSKASAVPEHKIRQLLYGTIHD